MNSEINIYRVITIIGFILFLFSLSFIPLRIERLLIERVDIIHEKESEEALAQFQSEEHQLLKEQMNELNRIVSQTNNQITLLIDHTSLINDSINLLMTRAVNEPHLLDTIQALYSSGILTDEIKIDSLNRLFRDRSNSLIEQIRVFNQKDRDLKIIQSGIRGENRKNSYLSISLLVQFAVLGITFICGVVLFISGLKKWRLSLSKNQDSGIEL